MPICLHNTTSKEVNGYLDEWLIKQSFTYVCITQGGTEFK